MEWQMERLSHVIVTAAAFLLCMMLSYSAPACKNDYCANSKAPNDISQVGGNQNYLAGGGGGGGGGLSWPCTSAGTAEQANALSLLQSGMDVCAVADQLNATRDPAYAALPGDTACVCYPSGPYVGCREFYMAQPDDGTPPTNSTWFGVTRCNPSCTDPNGCP
jgi:hypothetical protein